MEIELDLFVDYKTSFAFVLATDAVCRKNIFTNTRKRLLTK